MASETQDTLYDAFSNAAGSQAEVLEPIANASDELAESLQGVTGQMGEGPSQSSSGTSSSAPQSAASEALSIATTVLESGLGLIPLVTGLIGLFTGGDSTPAPLTKYAMPDKIDFEGADAGSGTSDMDYDQMGTPRTYDASSDPPPGTTSAPVSSPAAAAPLTGNVQAMDSQWFMDHSSDIAQAVRNAMLNLSSINDVVNDL
ncbi:MAG: hypothetical protein ABSH40_07160 [Bryobacteraceae bacterium]|jgi:hypothetical protein